MASELRVDTLKDSSGSNSVGMSYVAGGSAKAWQRISISGGTPSVDDSLNASTVTDIAPGQYQTNLTSNMGNTNYFAPNFSSYQSNLADLDRYGCGDFSGGGMDTRATTGAQVCGYFNGGYQDTLAAGTMAFGDLA